MYNLKNSVNKPTCFKNLDNPSCIDLTLTNKSISLIQASTIDTDLSDFHSLTKTIMNTTFQKQTSKILNYRNYNNVDDENFKIELVNKLNELNNLYGINEF